VKRRHLFPAALAASALGASGLTGCVGPLPPPPLTQLPNDRLLVLGPTADLDPRRPPPGWSLIAPERAAEIAVTTQSGRPALSLSAPGGASLVRQFNIPLTAAPGLEWSWKLESAAFGGGPGDGLARGLRLIIGFSGGGSPDLIVPHRWMRSYAGFQPHDRRIEISFGGTGASRSELASTELAATAEDGARRVLRAPAHGLTGGWTSEFVDLLALYRGFFTRDRFAEVTFAFVAIGALPARLPDGIASTIGHVVEIQVFK